MQNFFLILIIFSLNIHAKRIGFFDSEWSKSLTETLYIAQKKSYFDIPFDKAVVSMLNSFIKFDKNSRFLGPNEFKDLLDTTNGQFYGIGVLLAPKKLGQDYILVADIVKDSPADKSDLEKHDKIIAINNNLVNNLSLEEAIKLIKGYKRYSEVTLTVLRKDKILKFKIKRDNVKENNGCCYYINNYNIGYCSISLFTQETEKHLRSSLTKILSKKPSGLIIDLRNNAGGVLQSAVSCSSLFLKPNSLVVSTKNKKEKTKQTFRTEAPPLNINIPIFILVNEYTASAAEIFAGTLRHYSTIYGDGYRFPLIFTLGTKTFGKGSVQEVIPISNDCALKLTTCLYYLADNSTIQDKGIIPDFEIEESTISNKLNNKSINKTYESTRTKELTKDCLIQNAINLISLLNNKILSDKINSKLHNFDKSRNKIMDHKESKKFLSLNYATTNNISLEEL